MLTDWQTYKTNESWEDLREKVKAIPEEQAGLIDKNADFQRNLLLADRYFCDISVYNRTQRISVLYIGIDKDAGRKLLESILGLNLEIRPDLERILTPEEIRKTERADKKRTPLPNQI